MRHWTFAPPMRYCPDSPEGGFHRFKLPEAAPVVQASCVYCGVERSFDAAAPQMPFWRRRHRGEARDARHGQASRRAG